MKTQPRKNSVTERLKGIISTIPALAVPFEERVPLGGWPQYFGSYENQRWGAFDSDSCYFLSVVNSFEDQLDYLRASGEMPPSTVAFAQSNGFIDAQNDFSVSERAGEIAGGARDSGGNAPMTWSVLESGVIVPRSMLSYSVAKADSFQTQEQFDDDYFNPAALTPAMRSIGKQFRSLLTIQHRTIGTPWQTPAREILEHFLLQAPITIGIPIPANWNVVDVLWDGGKVPVHEVELYGFDAQGRYLIFDQYEPHLKTLSADYYVPLVTQGVVGCVQAQAVVPAIPQDAVKNRFWTAVSDWYNNIIDPVPVGSS